MSKKRVNAVRTILTYTRLQKAEKNKLTGIIPHKTLSTLVPQKDHPFFREMIEEIKGGKSVHAGSEANTVETERKNALREWTKERPTIVPHNVINMPLEKENKSKKNKKTKTKKSSLNKGKK